MTITCDTVVVGAGPAGLSAASLLSNNGVTTIVLEKNKSPGSQQTSYDITEGSRIRKILNEIQIKPHKICSISEWHSSNYRYILHSKIDDYYFKRGSEEDSTENILLKKLQKKNVNVLFESQINHLEIKKKEVKELTIKTPNEKITIQPKFIIGADGTGSNLRNRLQIKTKIYATFKGLGVVVDSEKQDEIPHTRIYFDKRLAPGGYIYSGSVKNKSFYCVVIDNILSKKIKLQKNLEKFFESKVEQRITPKNYFSGIGATGVFINHIQNVMFVGGAALFHDPFLGYGLNYAFESAYITAQAILQNNIEGYKKYTKEIQKEIKDIYKIREIWRNADNNFFDNLLLALNGKYNKNDMQINKIMHLFDE